jgi:hypothetical protein
MTLLWLDSFDGYSSVGAGQGYDLGATGHATTGRGGGQGIEVSGTGFVKRVPPRTELIVGYASRFGTGGQLMWFGGSQGIWFYFNVDALGNVIGTRGDSFTFFNEAPGMRLFNAWRYYEHKLKIGSGTNGSYELRIDEVPIVTLTGINTQVGGGSTALIQSTSFGGFLGTIVDDLYISDTLGSAPDNTFQGDLAMMNIHPNGPVETMWTPRSLPDNWDEVNDVTTDDLATYVEANAVATKDIYDYEDPNLPPGTVIVAVATMTSAARTSDSGPRELRTYIRGGVGTATATVEVEGAIHQLSNTYYMEQFLRATNPATGARWTAAEVDKIRAGFALTA